MLVMALCDLNYHQQGEDHLHLKIDFSIASIDSIEQVVIVVALLRTTIIIIIMDLVSSTCFDYITTVAMTFVDYYYS